jgi:hypothetical protein
MSVEYPKFVYYNGNARNSEQIDADNDPDAVLNDSRSDSMINPSLYEASFVRFRMSNPNNVPLFIPTIEIKQTNKDKTIYVMSIATECSVKNSATTFSASATRNVIFESQFPNETALAPIADTSYSAGFRPQDLGSRYYHVHDYNHMVKLFNSTLALLHSDIKTALDTAVGGSITQYPEAPYIIYDGTTNLFTIYMDSAAYGHDDLVFETSGDTTYEYKSQMYFNSNMYSLVGNLRNIKVANDVTGSDLTYKLMPEDKLGTNIYTYNSVDYIKFVQDFPSLTTWNAITAIVFKSDRLGALAEQNSQFQELLDGNETKTSFEADTSRVIFDLELPTFSADAWKQELSYSAQNYRMMTLSNATTELRQVDIRVYLRYALDGVLRPLKLFNQSSFSVKIMFKLKEPDDLWDDNAP